MYEITIARKHVTSNPRNVFFAVLSVSLAVAVIVVMMGLMEGYREEIIRGTVENNPHLVINPKEEEDFIYLYRTLAETVRSYPGVEAVSPRLLGQAGAQHRDEVEAVSFIGADPLEEDPLMNVQDDMVRGSYSDLVFKKRSAVIGTGLAEELDIGVGDDLRLIRQNRLVSVEITGLIERGTAADETLVYLPLETAQDLMGEGDVVSEVGLRLSNIYDAPAIAEAIERDTSYDASSWQDMSRDTLELLDTQNVILYLFYAIVFVIAGFGVANTMIMTVSRRTREIGILMAMGAKRWSILKIFLAESLILGPPSALLGILLAFAAARAIESYSIDLPEEIYMVSRMTVALTPNMFAYAAAFALFVNLVAGIYPALRASRLDPVEAIASE